MPLIDPDKIGWSLTKIFAVELFSLAVILFLVFITSRRIPQPFKAGDECDTTLSEAKTWYNVVYEKNYL